MTRDHLANERTFLAWLRTGAGVMVLGVGIARFVDHDVRYALLAGLILVAVGGAGLVYGTVRYRQVSAQIEAGEDETGLRPSSATAAAAVLGLAIVAAFVLLGVQST